jgi:hypothetical protein
MISDSYAGYLIPGSKDLIYQATSGNEAMFYKYQLLGQS